MKFYLRRIRLNKKGYTDGGSYFGIGLPLYCYRNDEISQREIRARDREHAKDIARKEFPDAKFFN